MKFKDKIVLITGAAGGYGERLAEAFHGQGATLILHGRSSAPLEKLKKSLGNNVFLYARDLTDAQFTPGLKQVIDLAGGVDIVINNAAEQGPVGRTWELDPVAWAQTIQVDLVMPAMICQLAIPYMIKRGGGRIINISGGGATGPRPNFSAYAAAKTAIARFTECLAEEAKEFNITANAIAPGVMLSKMHPQRTPDMPADSFAEPVALAVYLASPQAANTTGKLISAVWDPWRTLHDVPVGKDVYTLKRIIPSTTS